MEEIRFHPILGVSFGSSEGFGRLEDLTKVLEMDLAICWFFITLGSEMHKKMVMLNQPPRKNIVATLEETKTSSRNKTLRVSLLPRSKCGLVLETFRLCACSKISSPVVEQVAGKLTILDLSG
ncbi:hypothetical protein C5167_049511 [Papaver somniferum]|uniref:Uncharacterized protein n=1 Tax=Papaver somniferum TaxID=3469 RepID=A0A4Y7KL14_PAPSO|nr:hypothetical protein C5167_049511 [Papaver somniferum]